MSTHHVADDWGDTWFRLNWHLNAQTIEHAYEAGMISAKQWLDASRAEFLEGVGELLVASVADSLTISDALHLVRRHGVSSPAVAPWLGRERRLAA